MPTKATPAPAGETGEVLPAIYQNYRQWAVDIPEGATETTTVAILTQLAGAASADHLGDPWDAVAGGDLATRVLVVSGLKRLPSDFASGLGFFLVVTAADANTGEAVTFTTGSTAIVGQLVKAHHEGWLPLKCEVIRAEHPTANGYYPQHLRVYGDPDGF